MASESETSEMQSFLERLINSRNRDLSLFIPFLLGFTGSDPDQTRPESAQTTGDPDRNSENHSSPDERRERLILINPLTQGMVVIEGTGLDTLFRNLPNKDGPPPASKSSIEAMPSVEIGEGEEGECVICSEEWVTGGILKEMPCKHKFHGGCIEKWLKMHGSCPICRFNMPVEGKKDEEREEGGGERRREREIWVSFSFGGRRRRTEDQEQSNNDVNLSNSSDDLMGSEAQNRDTEMEN